MSLRSFLTLTITLVFVASGCKKDVYPPIITAFAWPDSVFPGDTVTIDGRATDRGGSELTLSVFCQGQALDTNFWITPKILGEYYLVFVADDGINVVQDSLSIFVMDTMGTFVDSRDNHEYKWVKIGQQIWMAENLAYLPRITIPSIASIVEACYYVYDFDGNNESDAITTANYLEYGALYNYVSSQRACPSGWHLPSDQEWMELEITLGMSPAEVNLRTERLSGNVGTKLKSQDQWIENGGGTNESGFEALPSGVYNGIVGFKDISEKTLFWTSTEADSLRSWTRYLSCYISTVWRGPGWKERGYPVRCIKDVGIHQMGIK